MKKKPYVIFLKSLLTHLILFLCLTILTSCPAKTYYLRSDDNGFSESQLGDTVYLITVRSRNPQDKKRLQDMFFLRAAEIAKEKGYPFFYTVEKVDDLTQNNPKSKPFKQLILTAVVYESITISGVVKLLQEKPEGMNYPIYHTETAYRQRQYLIMEKEKIFGNNLFPANYEGGSNKTSISN